MQTSFTKSLWFISLGGLRSPNVVSPCRVSGITRNLLTEDSPESFDPPCHPARYGMRQLRGNFFLPPRYRSITGTPEKLECARKRNHTVFLDREHRERGGRTFDQLVNSLSR